MAKLYGDENFDIHAINALEKLGHDTLTALAAGQANQSITDEQVLKFATQNGRAVVTFDRRDYFGLHKNDPDHEGIIACTYDPDSLGLAGRIHDQILIEQNDLKGKFIRIYRPNK